MKVYKYLTVIVLFGLSIQISKCSTRSVIELSTDARFKRSLFPIGIFKSVAGTIHNTGKNIHHTVHNVLHSAANGNLNAQVSLTIGHGDRIGSTNKGMESTDIVYFENNKINQAREYFGTYTGSDSPIFLLTDEEIRR